MSDRVKRAGIISAAEFVRFGMKSVIGIILARILVPADLGSYRQLFLIYSTFSTLMLLGIPNSLLYFIPKLQNDADRRLYISRTVNLVSILAFAFGATILISRSFIATSFNNPALKDLLLIYAVYPVFMFVTQIYSFVMLGMNKGIKAAQFTLFSVACDAVLILSAAFLTRNLSAIVIALIASAFLQWAFAQYQLIAHQSRFYFSKAYFKEQFHYSLPLGLSALIGMLSIQLDKFVISGFFTPEQFAVFSIGAMELPFISIFSNSVNSVLLPSMSEPGLSCNKAEIFRGAVRKNALIIFPLAMLFFIYAKPIVTLLYTSQYLGSVPFFQVYLLILPLRVAVFGVLFLALGKTKYILYNAAVTLCLNLILNIILVKQIGMMGAALATVIVTWISVLLYLFWMKTSLGLRIRDYYTPLPVIRTAASVLGAGLMTWLLIMGMEYSLLSQFIGFFLFMTAYLILGWVFKAIQPYDIDLVKSLLRDGIARLRK
ncbi:MAG: oligosaccharide flippase family protein [Candidatus Cloacimonadaceae bacterium]|nr:oligosaccharide flippase family protein [Candidatus Cloacimonadaceae bacterium]